MLPKKYRLNLGKEHPGRTIFNGRYLSAKSGENDLSYSRFGIVISRKTIPKATERNLWRRKIFFWIEEEAGVSGRDLVIILKKKPERGEEDRIRKELKNVLDFQNDTLSAAA